MQEDRCTWHVERHGLAICRQVAGNDDSRQFDDLRACETLNRPGHHHPRQCCDPDRFALHAASDQDAWQLRDVGICSRVITRQGQAAATGLYMYSVEDKGGKKTLGKFLIVKSDREGLN